MGHVQEHRFAAATEIGLLVRARLFFALSRAPRRRRRFGVVQSGRRDPCGPGVARASASAVAGVVMVLLLSSCAVMFNGATQTVPVSSRPDRAEVFVDGVSAGFTPLELELARNRAYEIEVRLGAQTRSFSLRSELQGAMVGLDLVPVAVAGGLSLAGAFLSAALPGPGSATPVVVALMGVSLVPIGVDFGTGAIYRLDPGEVVAVFE